MKRFIIFVIVVFIVFGVMLSSMLVSASRVSRYLRESDDHMRDVLVNYTHVYAEYNDKNPVSGTECEVPGKTLVSLAPQNAESFIAAVTRTGVLYRFTQPPEGESITVRFDDGAVYTVTDGGTGKDGNDIVYIIYEYSGRKDRFSLTGYHTYERVCECVSPEGFGTNNWTVEENDMP